VVQGGTGKAEAAKLPDAGTSPKQCPGKCAVEKGAPIGLSGNRGRDAVDPEAHKSCVWFKVTAFFSATGTWVDAG
jgi:hypothetical protein